MPRTKKPSPRVNKPIEEPLAFEDFQRRVHEEGLKLFKYAAIQVEAQERIAESVMRRILAEQHREPEPAKNAGFSATEDYRSVILNGQAYKLTRLQAEIIKKLHNAAKSGHPETHESAIREDGYHVRDAFRKRGRGIWEALVRPGERKGTYRLNLPT